MHLEAVVHAHAAAFIGRDPWEVARDPVLLADAHKTAWICYRHRLVMPGVDVFAVEAEAWGARMSRDGRPGHFPAESLLCSRLAEVTALPDLDPETNPRLALVLRAAQRLVDEVSATVAVPVSGPLALASALAGRDAVLAGLRTDRAGVRDCLLALVAKLRPWLRAIGAAGLQVAICEPDHDPAAMAPGDFATCIAPALTALVREAKAATATAPALLMLGDTAPIATALCRTGAGLVVCPATTDRRIFLEGMHDFPDTTVRLDFSPSLWVRDNWGAICASISAASFAARVHANTILGTGPLPLDASSVVVVDACNYAMNMDPWLDVT